MLQEGRKEKHSNLIDDGMKANENYRTMGRSGSIFHLITRSPRCFPTGRIPNSTQCRSLTTSALASKTPFVHAMPVFPSPILPKTSAFSLFFSVRAS